MLSVCNQSNCPFYDDGCGNPSIPDPTSCDIRSNLPDVDSYSYDAPLYVKFTYRDEWRHIPADDIYPVWNKYDVEMAAYAFRERHESDGALVTFFTRD